MLEIFNFIKLHWELLASIILIIVSFILTLIKKKPISSILEDIFSFSLLGIKRAENSGLKGNDKMKVAILFVINSLKHKYPGFDCESYYDSIRLIIEDILETPQKK